MSFIDQFTKNYTRTTINAPCPIDYIYKAPKNNAPLIIMFHGYKQTGAKILELLRPILNDDMGYLCANGPYPIPYKNKNVDEWRISFSWYFYDTQGQQYFINQEFPSEIIKGLVEQLGMIDYPKHIVGFSQGGYLAAFTALKLKNVLSNIALNAEYKAQLLPDVLPFPIYAINGEDDLIVDAKNAQKSFNQLIAKGNNGDFFLLKDTNHNINDIIKNQIKKII